MTPSLRPDNWQELLAGYVLGDLDPEELAQVQQLLADHPELGDEVRSLQATFDTLPYALEPQAPPPPLRSRIMAAAQSVPAAPPVIRSPNRRWRLVPWLGVGWAVTALALAALAVDNYRLRQAQEQLETVVASFSQPATRFYALAGTEAQPQASGRLVIDPALEAAAIVTDLPVLPEGQAYRLWALADSEPVYCGQFNSQPSHEMFIRWSLPDPACSLATAQLLITAESATAPLVPAGPLVLQSGS
ncbi:anti-sigma factor [Pseudanabaena sp. FACHB-2040]|uniref:anti-sigma factor n=1 Tax=Pseudanabaena sp. FACHB-2040 TaxID=2692859 RepID=UPI0016851001|nr:anti-sigma factor [Pseudanabaena sp. FACHB-2040]MBD2255974.1 anti-sigma factor [Pseudanabaena sp. FACHB-2040]